MQYIQRRIQRVSGVTIRDERLESRDFPVRPFPEDRDEDRRANRASSQAEARALQPVGAVPRERT